MSISLSSRIVIDTNVLFEGLTKQGGAAGLIIDAWRADLLDVYISNALAYEYVDVLSRKLSPTRWQSIQPVVDLLLDHAQFTPIYYSYRPTSPDPGDDLVIDCTMNAHATLITFNLCDFRRAILSYGLRVLTPTEFVNKLVFERK